LGESDAEVSKEGRNSNLFPQQRCIESVANDGMIEGTIGCVDQLDFVFRDDMRMRFRKADQFRVDGAKVNASSISREEVFQPLVDVSGEGIAGQPNDEPSIDDFWVVRITQVIERFHLGEKVRIEGKRGVD